MFSLKDTVLTTFFGLAVLGLSLASSGCSQPAEAPAPSPPPAQETVTSATDDHDDDHDHEHDADHSHDDDHEHDTDHSHDDDHGHSHHHEAPRGGTLIMLGDHVGHLEMLLDAAEGKLSVYALDGHAEHPVRLTAESLPITLRLPDDAELALELQAIENPLSGETVGDTSHFEVVDEGLQGLDTFHVMLPAFEFRGVTMEALHVPFPEGNE